MVCDAAPQFAKTRMPTSTAKNAAVCDKGPSGLRLRQRNCRGGFLPFLVAEDQRHQQADDHAEHHGTHRSRKAELAPRTLAVITIASTLMAGPE